jgi:D-glycero-beta-D-manno-heptose-7-phosphate kinase
MVLSPDRLEDLLCRAAKMRIAVVGDLMLDEYLIGSVTRISPEAPVPVVQVREHRFALGGAANVAANVSALGARCDLVGFVGRDAAGREMRRALEDSVDGPSWVHLVERADRPTTTKTRVMARKQQVVRFDRECDDDLPPDTTEEIVGLLEALLPEADAVILEDYNKGVLVPEVIRAAIDGARAVGIPSIVDPKFRRFFDYQGATVFKPNVIELGAALAAPVHPHDEEQLEVARRRVGCDHLLLTLGEEGMVLCSDNAPAFRIPAFAREVYDVSGAGDTVTAFLAVAMAAGATVQEAAYIANCAAAIEVSKPGVATVAPDELRHLLQDLPSVETLRV